LIGILEACAQEGVIFPPIIMKGSFAALWRGQVIFWHWLGSRFNHMRI
jgi:hypothetical protein